MKRADAFVRHERRARAAEIIPVRPVQCIGLHLWNYHVWREGHAESDRKCA